MSGMPIIEPEDMGETYDVGSHLTGVAFPFANKMIELGIIQDCQSRFHPDDELPPECCFLTLF